MEKTRRQTTRRRAAGPILLTLVTLAIACTKDPEVQAQASLPGACDQDEDRECLEPATSALRLDDEEGLGIVRIDPLDTGIVEIELNPSSTLRERVRPGVTLVRGRPKRKPVLRKVESVEVVGNVLRVQTKEATFRDAYQRGRIKRRVRFDRTEMAKASAADLSVRTQSGGPVGIDDCTGPLFKPPGAAFSVSLPKCRFVLGLDIDIDWVWGAPSVPESWEFSATGSVSSELLARLEIAGQGTLGTENKLFDFPDIPVPGLDITIGGELLVGYSVTSTGALTAEAGFTYDASRTIGFGWQQSFKVYDFGSSEKTFKQLGPTITGHAAMIGEVYVKPVITVKAFGVVGGSAGLKAYAALSLAGDAATGQAGKVCYDLSAGLAPTFGLEAGVLGWHPIKKEWETAGFQTTLDSQCTVNPVANSCKATDVCRADGDCPAKNACKLPSCGDDCLCHETTIEGCCLTDDDCDIPTFASTGGFPGACVDNKCKWMPGAPAGVAERAAGIGKGGKGKSFGVKESTGPGGATFFHAGPCENNNQCSDFDPETSDVCLEDLGCSHYPLMPDAEPSPAGTWSGGAAKTKNVDTGRACTTLADCRVDGDANTLEECRNQRCIRTTLPSKPGVKRCLVDAQCDDGNPDTRDLCIQRKCRNFDRPSDPCKWLTCDDRNPLTEDTCVNGACKHRRLGKP